MTPSYVIHYTSQLPAVKSGWDDPAWDKAEPLAIDQFHPKSSDHHPRVQARLLHDGKALAAIYRVEDRFIVCRQSGLNAMVCKDSCVEFFVRPKSDKGYINFEINCGGNILSQYVEDWIRGEDGKFKKSQFVAEKFLRMIEISTSLKAPIPEELPGPVTYTVSFRVPFGVFEAYLGALGDVHGQVWHANCYKCADESSHPHWAAWSNVGENLNFHQPERFGLMRME